MPAHICTACGTHYPLTEAPPAGCALCQDERSPSFGRESGWTTTQALRTSRFSTFRRLEPGLMGIGVTPELGLGHRALLLRTAQGNLLWNCPPFLDDATTTIVTALGGVAAIAVSDPTNHGAMVEWSHAFGTAPVYVHAADRKFIGRLDSCITLWEDNTIEPLPGVALIRCGGAFDGATVLHWAQGGGGLGALMVGEALPITPSHSIGFLRSQVNVIPMDAETVLRIGDTLAELPFDVIYGSTWERVVQPGARATLTRAVRRFVDAVGVSTEL